jgi:hypothetical protein
MKFYKMLLAGFASVTCAFGSTAVEQLRFVEISGASQGISFDSFAVSDSHALTLSTNGFVAQVGAFSQLLQFGIEKSGSVSNLVGTRSITATPSFFIVGGDLGSLAVGRVSQTGIDWQRTNIGASNSISRVAIIGSNLVAITGGRKTFYGSASNLNSFGVSEIQSGSIFENYVNVVGLIDGTGAIVGNGGVIRYSSNGGASFVIARPYGSSTVAVTDVAKLGNKLYATTADGNVLSSTVPLDLSKSPSGWNWQSVNVSGAKPLRSIAAHDNQLIAVGDGGSAFRFDGANWSAIENLPVSAKTADLIGVKTGIQGEFAGTVLIASKNSIFLGTPVPQPVVLSNSSTNNFNTCCAGNLTNYFVVESAAFVQVDWLLDGKRYLTNSLVFPLFESRPGIHKYQAVARDYRSGIESTPLEVTHEVYLNPEAPVAEIADVETCASEPTAELAVKPGTSGVIFRWYAAADAITNVFEGLRFIVPTTTNAVYFVEAVDTSHVTLCRSTNRTQVKLTVFANPPAPVALQSQVEQCAGDVGEALVVKPADGLRFEWFAVATGGDKVADGAAFVPTNRVSATYYVESVDTTHGTSCRSVTRTPVELKINPLPDAPKVASAKLSIASCEELPILEVHAVTGVKFAWYNRASGGDLLSTNASFTPVARVTETYHVEAISEITGCRSSIRTPITLTVRPLIELEPKDVVVRYGDTNTSVALNVDLKVGSRYMDYHTSTWSSLGDGRFGDSKSFSTTYVPGTNDLDGGIVNVSLEVVDSGILCSAQTAKFRIIYAKAPPALKISVDDKGVVTITWTPAPGYQLMASDSLSFTDSTKERDGEEGAHTIPVAEGVRFYRLVAK